ncbi:MAG: DUF4054 domain-containing protein [Bradymonadaceae bacterium]
MPTSVELLDRLASEFSGMSDSDKKDWLEIGDALTPRSEFPENYQIAVVLHTAHLMKLDEMNNELDAPSPPTGGVTSLKDRSTSMSGKSAGGDDASERALSATTYGAEYNRLKGGGEITTPIIGG